MDITELRIRGQVVDVTDAQMFAAALALSDRCRAAGGTLSELREVLAAIGVPEEALRSNLSLADTFAPPRVEPAPVEPVDDDSAPAIALCWKSLHPRIPANLAKDGECKPCRNARRVARKSRLRAEAREETQ